MARSSIYGLTEPAIHSNVATSMSHSLGKLRISCVKVDAEYTIQFEGMDWFETVPSIEAAIRRAADLVVEETDVLLYDATGIGVVLTKLWPKKSHLIAAATWPEKALGAQPPENKVDELKKTLATRGVRGAVEFLNAQTPHRFTSLYRFDGPTLRKVTFYDRENPDEDISEDIPVEASFCVFVRDGEKPFLVEDSASDDRLKGHPKRDVVKRYCGVPLLDDGGKMFGSICHFDFTPGRIEEKEVALLERMAELLRPSFAS